MPLYEYACKQCGHQFEKLVTLSRAREPQVCPSCGAEEAEKQMSTFAARTTSGGHSHGGGGGGGGGGGFS